MRHNQSVLNNYVPSFHLVGKSLFKKDKSLEQFQEDMKRYMSSGKSKQWFQSLADKETKIKMLYEQLVNKYSKKVLQFQ